MKVEQKWTKILMDGCGNDDRKEAFYTLNDGKMNPNRPRTVGGLKARGTESWWKDKEEITVGKKRKRRKRYRPC